MDYMFETGTILLTNFEFIGSSIILAKQTYHYRKVWLYGFIEDNAALVHSLLLQFLARDMLGAEHVGLYDKDLNEIADPQAEPGTFAMRCYLFFEFEK